jgi:hypothetical protein
VRNLKHKHELLPPWDMPSDPVKAVFWFLQWFLQVLVRFFYIPILLVVIYEIYLNGRVGGVFNGLVAGAVTLVIGLIVWAGLAGLLLFFRITIGLSHGLSELNRMQQGFTRRSPFSNRGYTEPGEGRVVEGSVTDLEEERRKRRPE